MSKTRIPIAMLGASALLAAPASAELLIYEPFDYAPTNPINNGAWFGDGNQAGGLGLGSWDQLDNGSTTVDNEGDVSDGGVTFTDGGGNVLPVAGNAYERRNRVGQVAVNSPIDPSATAALTADNTTIWMTFLFQDFGFSGPDFGIGMHSEKMVGNDNQSLVAAGHGVGFGITSSGSTFRNIHTAVYNNSTEFTKVNEATATFDGPGGSGVHLLAMKVNWNPSGTPDEIFVFDISSDFSTEPDESAALAMDTFDWDLATQQSLDVFNFSDTQVGYVDEVRVATTFAEAVGAEVPAATPSTLFITPSTTTPGNYDFRWESLDGMLYDLVSATDLSTSPDTWAVWEGQADLVATPPTNTLTDIAGGEDTLRFFAVVEKEPPPPPPLLSEDFEQGTPAGWAFSDNGAGTAWEVGTPDGSGSFPDTEPTGAANGLQCAGTNITAPYTASAAASLVTPAFTVPAGGATLSFSQYIDTEASPSGDLGSIRLLSAADDTPLAGGDVATGLEGITATWTSESLALPAAANGLEVKIEFRFESDADIEVYAGFYIDDVVVTGN